MPVGTAANAVCIVVALVFLDYTGYLWDDAFEDPWARLPSMLTVSFGALLIGILGYVLAQCQAGRPVRLRDPSLEAPAAEALIP